ncbi:rhomboid family intramembrane serine protease [Phyllobacterium sp. CCNWLW109]
MARPGSRFYKGFCFPAAFAAGVITNRTLALPVPTAGRLSSTHVIGVLPNIDLTVHMATPTALYRLAGTVMRSVPLRVKEAMLQSMKQNITSLSPWLSLSTGLALLTVAVSFSVAYAATGSPFSTVPVYVLKTYGGVTTDVLARLEIWRLATAQLIHAKQGHMLLNAITLLLLGNLLEGRVGRTVMLLLWLLAGGAATAISPLLLAWPFNVGTGASQANFAFAGSALVLTLAGQLRGNVAWPLIALALLPGLALDLWYVAYPKPGHVAGLIFGVVSGGLLMRLERRWPG